MSNLKKILYIHHSGNLGGAPRSLRLILDEVSKNKELDVDVLLLKDGPSRDVIDNGRVNIISSKGLFPFHGSTVSKITVKQALVNVFGLVSTLLNFKRYFTSEYDIVHLNSTCLCFYAMLIRKANPKVKIYCHIREPLLNNIWGGVIRYISNKYVDHFFAISEFDALSVKPQVNKITVVHNYVNTDEYICKPNNSCITTLKKELNVELVVAFFARLDEKNGICDFVELSKRFQSNSKCQFVIFGETGSEKANVQKALGSRKSNLSIYSMTSSVKSVLSDIDIIVCPFLVPHFSRSVIEAAALSKPSLIYNVGSLNELVLDNVTGYIAPVGSIDKLQEKLTYLLQNDNERKKMGCNARALAEEKFSHKNIELILNEY
jgi:glycosyltransferase involved in cell wall biosynthesis